MNFQFFRYFSAKDLEINEKIKELKSLNKEMKSDDPDRRPDIKTLMEVLNRDIFKLKLNLDTSSLDELKKINEPPKEYQDIIEIFKLYL